MNQVRRLTLLLALLVPPGVATAGQAPSEQHLEAYFWHLSAANDAAGKRIDGLFVKGRPPLSLQFTQGYFRRLNLCNIVSARYHLQGSQLITGDGEQTLIGCMGAVAEQEALANKAFAGPATLALASDGTLMLRNAGDAVLVFTPEPTPETRYGSPGEKLYLEVASRTVPCPQPARTGTPCLQVREVHYDSHGVQQGQPGAYVPFSGSIEGFTHQPGMRSVLMVKRFRIAPSRAHGATWAYVSQGEIRTTSETLPE